MRTLLFIDGFLDLRNVYEITSTTTPYPPPLKGWGTPRL
jgi:hypothetical protein